MSFVSEDSNDPQAGAVSGTQREEECNIDMIMDVELEVTLRFGRRQMALKDVAELTAGSVVELESQIHEPVELLLGDRILARGEVVIVDGNYGLRVLECGQARA